MGINRSINFVYRKNCPELIFASRRTLGSTKPACVEIPLQRWARWVKLERGIRDQIQDFLRGNYVEAKLHLGGLMYFIISSEYRCVQFRQHYIKMEGAKKLVHATTSGVSMSMAEFYYFLTHVQRFTCKIGPLRELVPCYLRRTHSRGCPECYTMMSAPATSTTMPNSAVWS